MATGMRTILACDTYVSHARLQVALGHPAMWCDINCRSLSSQLVKLLVIRSRSLPLRLTTDHKQPCFDRRLSIQNILRGVYNRVQLLGLHNIHPDELLTAGKVAAHAVSRGVFSQCTRLGFWILRRGRGRDNRSVDPSRLYRKVPGSEL